MNSIVSISENDLRRGETVALPIALLVMLVVFGGFLAAGMPLVGAIVSILGGLGALFGFTYLLDVNTTVVNVVTAVGLGLSIDYGLLIVSRFREEYRTAAMQSPPTTAADRRTLRLGAITSATDRAGRTVAYSGTVFAIASLGLLVFTPSIVKAIGLGALAVTLVSIASALTLLPALLSVTGEWIIRPGLLTRIPGVGRVLTRFGDVAPTEGFFSRLTRRVQKHPAAVTLACVALLLLLASPILGLRLANTSVDAIPASSTQYTFVSTLNAHFPAAAVPAGRARHRQRRPRDQLVGGCREARSRRLGERSRAGEPGLESQCARRQQRRRRGGARDPLRPPGLPELGHRR